MYPISMRGFAEVSVAPDGSKAARLRKYKFSKSAASKGRSNYYVKALSAIRHHHHGDAAKLATLLKDLSGSLLTELDSRKRAKITNNLDAISLYLKHFGIRKLSVKKGVRLYYEFQGLLVSSQPDLVVEENGELKLLKLNLGKKDYTGGVAGTMLHLLYEAAQKKGLPISSKQVEFLQPWDGTHIVGPASGFGPPGLLEDRSKEILALWPTVT